MLGHGAPRGGLHRRHVVVRPRHPVRGEPVAHHGAAGAHSHGATGLPASGRHGHGPLAGPPRLHRLVLLGHPRLAHGRHGPWALAGPTRRRGAPRPPGPPPPPPGVALLGHLLHSKEVLLLLPLLHHEVVLLLLELLRRHLAAAVPHLLGHDGALRGHPHGHAVGGLGVLHGELRHPRLRLDRGFEAVVAGNLGLELSVVRRESAQLLEGELHDLLEVHLALVVVAEPDDLCPHGLGHLGLVPLDDVLLKHGHCCEHALQVDLGLSRAQGLSHRARDGLVLAHIARAVQDVLVELLAAVPAALGSVLLDGRLERCGVREDGEGVRAVF